MSFYKYFGMEKSSFESTYIGPALDLAWTSFYWKVKLEV